MKLEGKIVAFLGDSITEGKGVNDIINNRYDNIIRNKCHLKKVYNYGISGTRIAHQHHVSEKPRFDLCFCGRAYDINNDVDIIIVYGGVNDYIHGDAYFGTYYDNTPETFCGGVKFLMKTLKALYRNAQIIFITPAHLHYDNIFDDKPSPRKIKKDDAKPLKEYVQVIEYLGREYEIPVLNLYKRLTINPNNIEDYNKYTIDGLHFNDAGHHVLANLIISFIENEV